MVSAIGSAGIARAFQPQGEGVARAKAAKAPGAAEPAPLSSPAAELAAEGAPVDLDRVAALRAAIADGSYTVDPEAIAARMMALDLPGA